LTTGTTPLLRAAIGADIDTVRLLLEHGALVDLPNVHGVTPLMAAAGHVSGRNRVASEQMEARAIEMLEALLAAGADINAKLTDTNALTARVGRQPSAVTEREGQTALFGAVKFGWTNVVGYLLANGADPNVKDALGKTPLDGALGRIGSGRDSIVSEEIAARLRAATARGPIAQR
jgi:ankyrin repeat protein